MRNIVSLCGVLGVLLCQSGCAREDLSGMQPTDAQTTESTTAEQGVAEVESADYELAFTMHPLYPIEPFFSVLYLDEEEQEVAELPFRMDIGWGYQIPTHLSAAGERPLPHKLDMIYYSAVEDKCYSLQTPLPIDKFKKLFAQKDAEGNPLYEDITFGAAPYGQVAMWVQRTDNHQTQFLGWLKGKEEQVPYETFANGFHITSGDNWQEFRENFLKQHPKAAENLAENGLPAKNLFDQFSETYNTQLVISFAQSPKEGVPADAVEITSARASYFNGETEDVTSGQTQPGMRAKIKEIQIHFKDNNNDNSSYLYVPYQTALDNQTVRQAYQFVFGNNPNQPAQLTFTFNGPSAPWLITLAAGDKQVNIPMEEIRFRNKFESYRTPTYYQPDSLWKGQRKPQQPQKPNIDPSTMNQPNNDGEIPLVGAVRSQQDELVTALLAAGADVNAVSPRFGQTALSVAASMGHTRYVESLIKAGADVNLPEEQSGMTPLMAAAQVGNVEIVELLLNAGADVNAPHIVYGQDIGYNALKYAQENNHSAVVQLLLAKNAKSSAPTPTVTMEPATSLDKALMAGDTAQVKILLAQGADPNTQIPGVGPALLFTCTAGNVEAAQALLDAKADVNAVGGTSGFTPLMMATQVGNKTLVEMLIKAGANVNIPHRLNGQETGLNALKIAQNSGFTEIATLLKAAGAKE